MWQERISGRQSATSGKVIMVMSERMCVGGGSGVGVNIRPESIQIPLSGYEKCWKANGRQTEIHDKTSVVFKEKSRC